MGNLALILNEVDYQSALAELSRLFDKEIDPDSPEGQRFEILLMQVHCYEARHYPISTIEAGG
jgi:HTH-type transcriptional regulator/antitoxin HigA